MATLGASADKSAQTSVREENVASSAASRTSRFDLRVPAVQDLHAELLELPEVLALELEKPKVHEPVTVGVRLAYGWRWFSGGSLLGALLQAKSSLMRREAVSRDGEQRVDGVRR